MLCTHHLCGLHCLFELALRDRVFIGEWLPHRKVVRYMILRKVVIYR